MQLGNKSLGAAEGFFSAPYNPNGIGLDQISSYTYHAKERTCKINIPQAIIGLRSYRMRIVQVAEDLQAIFDYYKKSLNKS